MSLSQRFAGILLTASVVATPVNAQDMPTDAPAIPTVASNTSESPLMACFTVQTKRRHIIPFIITTRSTFTSIDDNCIESNNFLLRYRTSIDSQSGATIGLVSDLLRVQYTNLENGIAQATIIAQPDSQDERGRRYSRSVRREAANTLSSLQRAKVIIDEGIVQDGRFPSFAAYLSWANENRLFLVSRATFSDNCDQLELKELGVTNTPLIVCGAARDRILSTAISIPPAQPTQP